MSIIFIENRLTEMLFKLKFFQGFNYECIMHKYVVISISVLVRAILSIYSFKYLFCNILVDVKSLKLE